jgi:hypothetical protein
MMTHDEFGPHLVKNPQLVLTKFSDKEILSSSYMFYSVILKFEANAIVDNIVIYCISVLDSILSTQEFLTASANARAFNIL